MGTEASELAIERFALEARALRAIGPPTVPELFEHGQLADGRPFLIMECLAGCSLAAVLEGIASPPRWELALAIAEHLLVALEATHAKGFVHRDLKPENVFVAANGVGPVRLIDFGLSSELAGAPLPGVVVGTIEYMAPEQLKGGVVDARTDIYAFGVLLFELLTLRPPFVGDAATIEHGHAALRPPRLRELVPLPEAVEEVVLACLAKSPVDRPSDATTVRAMLEAARADATVIVSAPERPARLAGSDEPAVLLFVEANVSGDAEALGAIATMQRGVLVKRRGRRLLFVFSADRCEHPLRGAIAAGRDMRGRSRIVIHLAKLAVREGDRGTFVMFGEAVERPEGWLPTEWQGLLVTSAVADAMPPEATHLAPSGWFELADQADDAVARLSLVGRAREMAQLGAGIEHSIVECSPLLVSVIGESGSGKSRLFEELRARSTIATISLSTLARQGLANALGLAAGTSADRSFARDAAAALTARANSAPLLVLVDDAHRCEPAVLDALEYVVSDAAAVPLIVVVCADVRLTSVRPTWGARALRHDRIELAPLDAPSARHLAADALLPAEYVPHDVIARLAGSCAGNPGLLLGMIGELKRVGAVQRRPNGTGWMFSTELMGSIGKAPADRWLASRALAEVTADLATLVRMCSVLGSSFGPEEVVAVQHELERTGAASSRMDAAIGIEALLDAHILERDAVGLRFRLALIQAALSEQVVEADRRTIHAAAVTYWKPRADGLESLAHHATGANMHETAAAAHLELGELAAVQHRDVDADRHFCAALHAVAAIADASPLRALAGRGKIRMRLHRLDDAVADLVAARGLAHGDEVAQLWLDEAIVHDWAEDYPAAARCIAAAAALGASHTARFMLADGCARWRQGDVHGAVEYLTRAKLEAMDTDTRIVAGVLLGPALVVAGKLDEAVLSFGETIELATRDDDLLHLCAVHANRLFLWSAQHMPARAIQDLDTSARLAREIGHAALERIATHNLAELLFWGGDLVESLRLAQRSRLLQERFGDQDTPEDALLLARIYLARRDLPAVRHELDWIASHRQGALETGAAHALERAVRFVLEGADRASWQALIEVARANLPLEEADEVARWHRIAGADHVGGT